MRVRSAAATDQGPARQNNEDRVYADNARGFFLVVDGMGGHAAGEVAAEIALKSIRGRLERETDTVERRIREAIALANNAIHDAAKGNPEWAGMACVLTVTVLGKNEATVGHVGDSRLYKIRGGAMKKITHDHSPVGEREDSGELNEKQAMAHPRRNEVYRDVGSDPHTPDDPGFIEISTVPFEPDAGLLLCSDGLSDVVPASEILSVVERHAADPETAVRELIASANRNSKDNVSAVLIEGESFGRARAQPMRLRRWPYLTAGLLLGGLATFAALRFLTSPVSHPKTIQIGPRESVAAALRDAEPGDTIELAPGEYSGAVRLKDGVDLTAQREHESTLTGGVVADGVRRARVTGLRIAGGDTGIRVRDANVTIERVEVTGTRVAAIEFSGTSNGVVEASSLHDNAGAAIVVRDRAAPLLVGNRILERQAPERPR